MSWLHQTRPPPAIRRLESDPEASVQGDEHMQAWFEFSIVNVFFVARLLRDGRGGLASATPA